MSIPVLPKRSLRPLRVGIWRLSILCGAGAIVLRQVLFALRPPPALIFPYVDDAFYYLKTASNFASGLGLTFDGLNQTNGFHPLWFLVVTAVYRLTDCLHLDTWLLPLRIILVIQGLLVGLGIVGVFELLRREACEWVAGLGIWFFILYPGNLSNLLLGVEGSILFLAFVIVLLVAAASLPTRLPSTWKMGIGLGVLCLARLDSIFLAGAFVLPFGYQWLRAVLRPGIPGDYGEAKRAATRRVLGVAVPAMVMVLTYVTWNWIHFGHLTPISGSVKSSFPTIRPSPATILDNWRFLIALLPASLVSILVLRRKIRPSGSRDPLGALVLWTSVGLWGNTLYDVFFVPWGVFSWYFALFPLLLMLGCAWIGKELLGQIRKLAGHRLAIFGKLAKAGVVGITLVGLSLVTVRWIVRNLQSSTGIRPTYSAAVWASQNLPADAVVGMMDCGVFGYFSQRRVVNLDGLINGYEYQHYFSSGRLIEYLDNLNVRYLAFSYHAKAIPMPVAGYQFTHFPVYSHGVAQVVNLRGDQELYRIELEEPSRNVGVIIWER